MAHKRKMEKNARAAIDSGSTVRSRSETLDDIRKFLDTFDTCHLCRGVLSLDDLGPVHCENCTQDCEAHEGPACTAIYILHANARRALNTLLADSANAAPPQSVRDAEKSAKT